jgi:hypothetical protein
MRAVNLLPASAAPKRTLPPTPVVVAAATPLIVASLVLAAYSVVHAGVVDKQGQLAAVRAEIEGSRPVVTKSTSTVSDLAGERALRQAALDDVLTKTQPWDSTLRDLARLLPDNVWLTALSTQSPTPADVDVAPTPAPATAGETMPADATTPPPPATPPAPKGSLTLSGFTTSQDSVAHLLARLRLLPMLGDVTLGSTTASKLGEKPVIQFEVTAVITPATPVTAT